MTTILAALWPTSPGDWQIVLGCVIAFGIVALVGITWHWKGETEL